MAMVSCCTRSDWSEEPLNYNTCRMYAGGVYETDTDRDKYVIQVTVNSFSAAFSLRNVP